MITFSRLGQHGRLGNILFQIAATIGIAERNEEAVGFPNCEYSKYFPEIKFGNIRKQVGEYPEQQYHYEDVIVKDCDLVGYFQSEKYFPKNAKHIFDFEFKFQVDILLTKLPDNGKKNICVHIRRGDYVDNVNYYQLPISYYIDSLLTFFPDWKDYNIIIISDDIEYCKVHFECLPNVTFAGGTDIEDLALASLCDHFIIPNSTYGWWAAWLGEKPGSKIVHPGHLFRGKLASNDTKDFWPERWTRFQKDSYKIDLLDVTFTIPVHFDNTHRKLNADLSVCMLMYAFDSNFIMMEQGGDKFKYFEQWCRYEQFTGKEFHRTKMLNDMAYMSKTDIISNWDCDVIVPPMQVYLAVDAIRNGADMVFPYNGPFARMPRDTWFKQIQHSLDIGIVKNTHFKGRERDHNSVGGAVFFYKDSFIDGGMENEYMVSFGPEDCERNDRFKALGYDVRQVVGSLFHMDHYCGPNSSPANPRFRDNHKELEKIRGMLDEPKKLMEYVDTWPWVNKNFNSIKKQYRQWICKS